MQGPYSKYRHFWAVVPAAGLGLRMGAAIPKQYLELDDKSILEHTLTTLVTHPRISKVVVALHVDDHYWQNLSIPHADKLITTVGGERRADSVLHCLGVLEKIATKDDWVLVHDAVRPLLTHALMSKLMDRLCEHPVGGLLATPVYDTLKRVDDRHYVCETLSREQTWCAQTPQMFRFQLLFDALKQAISNKQALPDSASAIELLGKQPYVIQGDPRNIKITHPLDLELAKLLIQSRTEC